MTYELATAVFSHGLTDPPVLGITGRVILASLAVQVKINMGAFHFIGWVWQKIGFDDVVQDLDGDNNNNNMVPHGNNTNVVPYVNNNNNNTRLLVTLAEHTSDHGKQTNSNTNKWGEGS